MHTELHWLDVPERVKYKLGVITRRCLYDSAPRYLAACFVPVSTTASRQHLRSAAGHQLVIQSHRLTTYGRRAFSVVGTTGVNFYKAARLEPPLFKLLGFQSSEPPNFFVTCNAYYEAVLSRYIMTTRLPK